MEMPLNEVGKLENNSFERESQEFRLECVKLRWQWGIPVEPLNARLGMWIWNENKVVWAETEIEELLGLAVEMDELIYRESVQWKENRMKEWAAELCNSSM